MGKWKAYRYENTIRECKDSTMANNLYFVFPTFEQAFAFKVDQQESSIKAMEDEVNRRKKALKNFLKKYETKAATT